MRITVELVCVELDDMTCGEIEPTILIRSHAQKDDLVVMELGEAQRLTLRADSLISAINKATNWKG